MKLQTFYKIYYKHRIIKANLLLKIYLLIVIPIKYFLNLPYTKKKINLENYSQNNKFLFEKNLNFLFEFFEILKISKDEAREKFGFLIDALESGCPPHGGIAFGLDRIVMLLTGTTNLRDAIAFPKTQTATCMLTDAPGAISAEQLKELAIKPLAKKE